MTSAASDRIRARTSMRLPGSAPEVWAVAGGGFKLVNVVLAVADDRDAAAARVAQLVEEVDVLDPLGELLLVPGHLIEEFGVGDDDETPLLCRDADRVDVPEPAVVVELRVVVVQDVEVRESLAVRHQPADGVRDLDRRGVAGRGGGRGVPTGRCGARRWCWHCGVRGWWCRHGSRWRCLRYGAGAGE